MSYSFARFVRRLRNLPNSLPHHALLLVHRVKPLLEMAVLLDNMRSYVKPADKVFLFDYWYPSPFCGYRTGEYHAYFERFPGAEVQTLSDAHPREYVFQMWPYKDEFPQYARRVLKYHPRRRLRGAGASVVFLNVMHTFIEAIEKNNLPFVFTLYPGGEFRLDQPKSDAMLKRIMSSPLFRKVIVTQPVTRDYLLRKGFCTADQIEYIFGVVISQDQLNANLPSRLRYGIGKSELDICFVAHKHMPGGIDKGYDRFISAAHLLQKRDSNIKFHVVGPYDASDADICGLENSVTFYGIQSLNFFPDFYAKMDIIVSPNVPFVLAPGAFDGFPLSTCTEAGLCGTAVFCTDPLNLNQGTFKEGEEIVILSPEPEQICQSVETYLAAPERLAQLAERGQRAFQRVFSFESQIEPRLRVISSLIGTTDADTKN